VGEFSYLASDVVGKQPRGQEAFYLKNLFTAAVNFAEGSKKTQKSRAWDSLVPGCVIERLS